MMVVLGLGSNLGDRLSYLRQAIALLSSRHILTTITASPLYESDALLLHDAPPEWNLPYLNMAIKGTTTHSAESLITAVKGIEQEIGRKQRDIWSPREIDIDILAYGESVVTQDDLTIPHIALLERPFALLPFADIHPKWRFPVAGASYGKTATELAKNLGKDGINKLPISLTGEAAT